MAFWFCLWPWPLIAWACMNVGVILGLNDWVDLIEETAVDRYCLEQGLYE